MRCYIEFITAPTADTPGTLILLHYDEKRYLIGRLSEGSSRACVERNIALRKVSDILLTGRTEWANIGGLLGMILGLADTKTQANAQANDSSNNDEGNRLKGLSKTADGGASLKICGGRNLNHVFATSRRFIFRTGMPLNTTEVTADAERPHESKVIEPSWQDNRILVWTMPILPSSRGTTSRSTSPASRKRHFEETLDSQTTAPITANDIGASSVDHFDGLRKHIVQQMFNSDWHYDRLVPQRLSDVRMPATCFLKDPRTNKMVRYAGPMPGGDEPVPDLTVFARQPWPGALTEHLPPTKPAEEAVSYIIRNYPQRGKFLREKARDLRVPEGPLFSKLANGESVKNAMGETITPDMVLEPGKQGNGFAVVDLPDFTYVEPLINRPEWRAENVMDGIGAIVWILGPGVAAHPLLRQFQEDFSRMKHIVSSSDYCPNVLAFEGAAGNALRHHIVEPKVFPMLESSPLHNENPTPTVPSSVDILPLSVLAQRGQVMTLEPTITLIDDQIVPPLNLSLLEQEIETELRTLDNHPISASLEESYSSEVTQWEKIVPYGDVEMIVLGTGSSHPSKYRNVSGTLVRIPNWGSVLLDCGEGTLNTLRRMFPRDEFETVMSELRIVWISHMHADHHLGLTSVIKTWNKIAQERNLDHKLAVVSHEQMLRWLHEYNSAEDIGLSRILPLASFPSKKHHQVQRHGQWTMLRFVTSHKSHAWESETTTEYLNLLNLKSLNSVLVNHCHGAQAVSFTLNNGFKFSYSGDCRPSIEFVSIGKQSHILVHEATFEDNMRSEAVAKKHSTAGEALIVASEMEARSVLLTHFSQRYPTMPDTGVALSRETAVQMKLSGILEKQDETQPDASLGETEPTTEHVSNQSDGNSKGLGGTSPKRRSSLDSGLPFGASTQLIPQQEVESLVRERNMKVVFAFDYMRLRLCDIPRLEKRQGILRDMYAARAASKSNDVAENINAQIQSTRQLKKKEKAEKIKKETESNSRRRFPSNHSTSKDNDGQLAAHYM